MQYYIITQSSIFGYVFRTWNEVDDLCKEINSSLPTFETKDKINEFLALLKTSEAVHSVPIAVPIALSYNYSMVGIYIICIFSLCYSSLIFNIL